MKESRFLLLLLAGSLVVFSACEKDQDKEIVVKKENIIGTWEVTGGDDYVACPDGDNQLFVISDTQIKEGQTNNEGCQITGSYVTLDYEFIKGNTLDAGLGAYKITKFETTTMTIEMSSPLAPGVKVVTALTKK